MQITEERLRDILKEERTANRDEMKGMMYEALKQERKETRKLVREEMVKAIAAERKETKILVHQEVSDQTHIATDILRQEIRAAETRMSMKIEETKQELRQDMATMKQEIAVEVADIIGEAIVPQIDNHEHRIVTLETRAVRAR